MKEDPVSRKNMADTPLSFGVPEIRQCPFAAYDKLRSDSPVYKDPLTGNYVLTRYADVRRATLDVKSFSSRQGLGASNANSAREEIDKIYDTKGWRPIDTLQSQDPPEHRIYRQLVDKAFSPAKIDELEPRIDEIIRGLIDTIIDKPEVEFLDEFAIKLPMTVIAEQIGVDPQDMALFKIWSDAVVEVLDPTLTHERQIAVANTITEMQQYLAAVIERAREKPDDRLLSRLVHAEVDGRKLNMRELLSILRSLIVAGNETTTTTLAAGMKLMIDHPELAGQLREEPGLMRNFVEETLRVMSPVQTLFRRTTGDTELAGVTIPAGALVEVRFGAANRDPAVFESPATLDLKRPNANAHMAFGFGPHICIGNQLARAELRLAFKALINHMDNFRASRGEDSYAYTSAYVGYGLTKLWMHFDKR